MAQRLESYLAKRDFTKTSEPSGKRKIKSAQFARFVIQKHDATRLHYDLRLEMDGVFKSWAVTRGPSLDPGDKRLAVEVEDHPLDYGDFEGTIPEGQYGGGTVMLWDRGFFAVDGGDDPLRALKDGEFKFTLAGDKLKGGFVLVRMKRDRTGGKRVNWLLIKHRDAYARPGDGEKVLAKDRSCASGRTMKQIAAGKGQAPTPFMAAGDAFDADAVWTTPVEKVDVSTGQGRKPRTTRAPANFASVRAAGSIVVGIKISKPDKILWPATAGSASVSKLQLAEYLATVGPWMLAHLAERPCSVVRAPDGIGAQTFFQRHEMPGMPDAVSRMNVRGDREAYIAINTVAALVGLGQLAALEFHPWNCAPGRPETPGRLVFDLDPGPGVDFDAVVTAAKEIKERLEAVGLVAFAKTTGGKGLHVVTPLKSDGRSAVSWDQARMFAEAVCAQMADDSPRRYLTKMSKKLRDGRIFLDYLRNDRTATAVAPLSPRAREGATVSMPLTWGQVRAGLDPRRFTIHSAAAQLRASRAWQSYASSERGLRSAIKKLVGA